MKKIISLLSVAFCVFVHKNSEAVGLLQAPYVDHNMLIAAFEQDSDQCFTIDDVRMNDNMFVQNITANSSEVCQAKSDALTALLSQSTAIPMQLPNYAITVNGAPIPSPAQMSAAEECKAIETLFHNNKLFKEVINIGNVPLSPNLMVLYSSKVVKYYTDDLSENHRKNYMSSAALMKKIFDFNNSGLRVSSSTFDK